MTSFILVKQKIILALGFVKGKIKMKQNKLLKKY